MHTTRVVSIVVFSVVTSGLALLALGDTTLVLIGSALATGGGIVFTRHFWRESDRKRKQEMAASSQTLSAEVAKVMQAVETQGQDLEEGLTALGRRVDGFSVGILEYVTQLEMDVEALHKRIEKSDREAVKLRNDIVTQVSGVIGVYATLDPGIPYPNFGGWAIGGDCAQRLIARILSIDPRTVIEVASGLSTLLIAQTLELLGGDGRVVSVEHDEHWLRQTSELVAAHGMAHRVAIFHAPLVDTQVGDEVYPWYDLSGVDLPTNAQLIFVDGPPTATGTMARYPVLPLLAERLDEGAILMMDDAARSDERATIERWREEYPQFSVRFHSDSKGTVEITKERL